MLSGEEFPYKDIKGKIIFYLPFDGDIKSQGTYKVEKIELYPSNESLEYTVGIKGQSLITGKNCIKYFLSDILKLEQGTISLWIKPVDWDEESYLDFLHLFSYSEGKWKPIFRIYRPSHSHLGLVFLRYNEPPPHCSMNYHRERIDTWQKQNGQWHQVVFTWNADEGKMYIDAMEITTDPQIAKTLKESNVIQIGGVSTKYPSPNSSLITNKITAIDEVVFYDYVFNLEQIKKDYEKFMGKMEKIDNF